MHILTWIVCMLYVLLQRNCFPKQLNFTFYKMSQSYTIHQ